MKSLKSTFGALAAGLVLASGCDKSEQKSPIRTAKVGEYLAIDYNYAGMHDKDTFLLSIPEGTSTGKVFYSINTKKVGDAEILEVTPEEIKYRRILK